MGILDKPSRFKRSLAAALLSDGALDLALLLRGLIIVILPALKFDFGAVFRLHGLQFCVGIGALGYALYVRPEAMPYIGS